MMVGFACDFEIMSSLYRLFKNLFIKICSFIPYRMAAFTTAI